MDQGIIFASEKILFKRAKKRFEIILGKGELEFSKKLSFGLPKEYINLCS